MTREHQLTELEARQTEFLTRANAVVADEMVENHMRDLRQKHEAAGFLVTEERFGAEEDKVRREFDRATRDLGTVLELDIGVMQQLLADDVAAEEPLRPLAERHGTGTEKFLLAAVVDELQGQRARVDLAGRTRAQVLELYTAAVDDRDNALVRMIEAATGAPGGFARFSLKDNPEHDGLSIPQLQAAVQARRAGRVSEATRTAHARASQLRSQRVTDTMQHFRSGRGIAWRPRPLTVAVR